jgi:hypothetical protein
MTSRKREAWTLITPLAYRRPHRPDRRVLLVASGLALSTVVAGLAVLGSIHPTSQSAPAPTVNPAVNPGAHPGATPSTTPAPSTTVPTAWPTGTWAVAYGQTRAQSTAGTGGYLAPSLTPTTAPPPPITTTNPNNTYTMTYDSGTVVVIYPDGGGDGGDDHDGGGRHGGGH